MKTTIKIIKKAAKNKKAIIAFSGGSDSMILLDIIYKHTDIKAPILWTDSQMEHASTLLFIRDVARKYGAKVLIARAPRTPEEQFNKIGWPMLGKLAARLWMQKNKDKDFKCNVSECCRTMKILPGRRLMKQENYILQFTGQRGDQDDALRGMRAIKDGAQAHYNVKDKIYICNPLTGWTDTMTRRYTSQNNLMVHPARKDGAITIGCMFCGGGAQFTNSGFRILRKINFEEWYKFMIEWKAGEIVLALKYETTRAEIQAVIAKAGGLEYLADSRPWIFDYIKKTPIQGYNK